MRLRADVNHGRWVVRCPACPSAALARDTFTCVDCGFGPVRVAWPQDVTLIEAALSVRPIENRNWRPGETVADLEAENAEHMRRK